MGEYAKPNGNNNNHTYHYWALFSVTLINKFLLFDVTLLYKIDLIFFFIDDKNEAEKKGVINIQPYLGHTASEAVVPDAKPTSALPLNHTLNTPITNFQHFRMGPFPPKVRWQYVSYQ